ncbi:hypothetical protein RRF57_001917 [Xylaria bambusicola]|uniref:Uncharacterized protein n=1 Tax=Xylaria bambusicola TaxID=326684 RepID=A0AAN7UEI0_9PEZI
MLGLMLVRDRVHVSPRSECGSRKVGIKVSLSVVGCICLLEAWFEGSISCARRRSAYGCLRASHPPDPEALRKVRNKRGERLKLEVDGAGIGWPVMSAVAAERMEETGQTAANRC